MNPLTELKRTTSVFLIAFGLACFGFLGGVQAVVPAPDGGYPGGNTAEGQAALLSRTTGGFNTAVGFLSLRSDTSNSFNTAIGAGALLANTADNNTATGAGALLSNTTGSVNTAYGAFALFHNTTGGGHTGIGYNALGSTNASDFLEGNTAVGSSALTHDTNGNANTAVGFGALLSNTTGNSDTAIGNLALGANTTGSSNTAIGWNALAGTTADLNTALGVGAGSNQTTGSNNIYIGDLGEPTDSNVIAIGAMASSGIPYARTYIGGVYDNVVTDRQVYVNSAGGIGTLASSRRYKEDIRPMDKTSETLFALKPVTFRYKHEFDPSHRLSFGLIAEEVAKENAALVLPDKEGKPYTVRYEAVNAMLLNEFLKEHKTVQGQGATIARLEQQIGALTSRLQKVSAQLEVSKPAPQTVLNNR